MNYRHAYHAGNFADVFKHIILVALTQALLRKDKGFCFLDTHAGVGHYNLLSAPAQKSKEFLGGIAKIMQQDNPPPLVKTYIDCVKKMNLLAPDTLQYYPGSPAIVRQFLRENDRMVLTELHEDDYLTLRRAFPHDKKVGVHHQDGYLGLKAFLPPPERRGLVLIDPPYEKPDELSDVVSTLGAAVTRWDTGIFALWYPVKESRSIVRFHRAVKLKIERPTLAIELNIFPDNLGTQLNGNGMIIVNPPWQFEEEIKAILPWLWRTLSPNQQGHYDIKTL
jgi:23S rRNA (adenine2030-N6)-methyltransferase